MVESSQHPTESGETEPPSGISRSLGRGAVFTAIGLTVVYAWMVSHAGSTGWRETLERSEPWLLPLPLLATLLSYLTMSFSYEGIARAAGCAVSSMDMLRITFIANTVNYVLPTGGLSGFALRMVLLNKKGVSGALAVLVSFTQTVLTNLMLLVFVVFGLAYLIATGELSPVAATALLVLVTGLTVFLGASVMLVYREELRGRFLSRATDSVLRWASKFRSTAGHERRIRMFFLHLAEGMDFFASKPRAMVGPTFWIFLDWLFTVAVLYTACLAVGAAVSYGEAVVAFSVGIVFAVASFVPGGVGVLELALAGMFATVGVPPEESVLAIFVFRVSFYVIPVLLSLVLARGAFRQVDVRSAQEMLG
jgi:uncharacterized protein (TIRG00374 family)